MSTPGWEREREFQDLLHKCMRQPTRGSLDRCSAIAVEDAKDCYKAVSAMVVRQFKKVKPADRINALYVLSAILRLSLSKHRSRDKYVTRLKPELPGVAQLLQEVPPDSQVQVQKVLASWRKDSSIPTTLVDSLEMAVGGVPSSSTYEDAAGDSGPAAPSPDSPLQHTEFDAPPGLEGPTHQAVAPPALQPALAALQPVPVQEYNPFLAELPLLPVTSTAVQSMAPLPLPPPPAMPMPMPVPAQPTATPLPDASALEPQSGGRKRKNRWGPTQAPEPSVPTAPASQPAAGLQPASRWGAPAEHLPGPPPPAAPTANGLHHDHPPDEGGQGGFRANASSNSSWRYQLASEHNRGQQHPSSGWASSQDAAEGSGRARRRASLWDAGANASNSTVDLDLGNVGAASFPAAPQQRDHRPDAAGAGQGGTSAPKPKLDAEAAVAAALAVAQAAVERASAGHKGSVSAPAPPASAPRNSRWDPPSQPSTSSAQPQPPPQAVAHNQVSQGQAAHAAANGHGHSALPPAPQLPQPRPGPPPTQHPYAAAPYAQHVHYAAMPPHPRPPAPSWVPPPRPPPGAPPPRPPASGVPAPRPPPGAPPLLMPAPQEAQSPPPPPPLSAPSNPEGTEAPGEGQPPPPPPLLAAPAAAAEDVLGNGSLPSADVRSSVVDESGQSFSVNPEAVHVDTDSHAALHVDLKPQHADDVEMELSDDAIYASL